MASNLSISTRLLLVSDAIERIRAAKSAYIETQINAASTCSERLAAKAAMASMENEFRWQWQNVEALISEYKRSLEACRAVVDANDHGMTAEEGRRAVELCRAVIADEDRNQRSARRG